jgi:hypothetical protein
LGRAQRTSGQPVKPARARREKKLVALIVK